MKHGRQRYVLFTRSALVDMSIDSRQKVITWKRTSSTDLADPKKELIADYMEEVYEKQDCFFCV